ncbi:MAG TPA: plasmid stabilization protein, partial [Spirochaetia bacterium]
SVEYNERDVLAVLIERYEEEHYPIDPPDAVEALKFRMEQGGLTRKDLEPHLGGRARVSEVLSGKRELSLSAIRALHAHLGIPSDVLIGKRQLPPPSPFRDEDLNRLPLKELTARGVFHGFGGKPEERPEQAIHWLTERAGGIDAFPPVGFRSTANMRVNAKIDPGALACWCLCVLARAREDLAEVDFTPGSLTADFVRGLVSLSVLDDGPRYVPSFLAKVGISFVIVSHLKHTYLDGGVFLRHGGRPIIALTLRYDRLDNFWFVLLHEVAHLAFGHLSAGKPWIADDLDMPLTDNSDEAEADEYARDHLLPRDFDLHLRGDLSVSDIVRYAKEKAVNPAIVAGRVQHERKDYRTFARLLGHRKVRQLFEL